MTPPLTILFITRKYPPSVGGMQQLSYHLIETARTKATVYAIKWGGSQVWLPLFVVYALIRALVILATRPVDVVHVGDPVLAPLGVILRRVGRRPVVVNAHGLDVVYPNRLYQTVVIGAMRRLDGVICISEGTRHLCLERGLDPARLTVIPVGVQVDDFALALPEEARMRWGSRWRLPRWPEHILLFVGRLIPRKGGRFLVSRILPLLAARRRDWVCLIVGDGPERPALERMTREQGLSEHVRLLGRVSAEELRAAYAAADVFIMPNVPVAGDFEGFGIVALEARASGLPVVAADLEGIGDSFQDGGDGVLVTPGDAEAFVRAIEALLDGRTTATARRERRRRVRERYGWSHIADEYLRTFHSIRERYDAR